MYPVTTLTTLLNGQAPKVKQDRLNLVSKTMVAAIIGDVCISASALALGILKLNDGAGGRPTGAAIGLLAVSGLITSAWGTVALFTRGGSLVTAEAVLRASIKPYPTLGDAVADGITTKAISWIGHRF